MGTWSPFLRGLAAGVLVMAVFMAGYYLGVRA